MPDYSKCVIYKLCCNDLNIKEIYVGSTCNFTRRKCEHKSVCHNENDRDYNCPVYQFIRENGGFENWSMILVEEYPCENKQQKVQRERYWFEELKAELNNLFPTRDRKEWCETNKEQIKQNVKEYYETHKEKISERKKITGKIYYEKNKEKINEQNKITGKIYYEKNKEKRSEKRKETMTCECGSVVRIDSIRRHERSKKHLDYINKN